jgi:hypothetical protein
MADQWMWERDLPREHTLDLLGGFLKNGNEADQWASMLTDDEVLMAARGLALRLVRNAVGDGHQVARVFTLSPHGWKAGDPLRVAIELANGTTVIFPHRRSK